jgi:hypothetical protein
MLDGDCKGAPLTCWNLRGIYKYMTAMTLQSRPYYKSAHRIAKHFALIPWPAQESKVLMRTNESCKVLLHARVLHLKRGRG